MKKQFFILGAAMLCLFAVSCQKSELRPDSEVSEAQHGSEITLLNGVVTKGYVDGTRFYDKSVASLHSETPESSPRTMRVSAYLNPQEGSGRNYFINELFESNKASGADEKWIHTPAFFWPLGGNLDFLCISSTEPFTAKDLQWNESNASSYASVIIDKSRTQDDILFAVASGSSATSTSTEGGVYTTGKPVNVQFSHAQAWLEFQLSVADELMKNKIAIKEIVIDGGYDSGKLKLSRNTTNIPHTVDATWVLDGKMQFSVDDQYQVYGRQKNEDEYMEYTATVALREAVRVAREGGDAAEIAAAEAAYKSAMDALQKAMQKSELINPLNIVGALGSGGEASAAAEHETNCAYLDMLVPAQDKCDFIIRYYLAGSPDLHEYRFKPKNSGSDKWEMGKKYIYDIDFVISEIAFAPTVKEFVASFDAETNPAEIK